MTALRLIAPSHRSVSSLCLIALSHRSVSSLLRTLGLSLTRHFWVENIAANSFVGSTWANMDAWVIKVAR